MSDDIKRRPDGTLLPGQGRSLNPGGRALQPHLRKRCRKFVDEHVVEIWEKEILEHGDHWFKCSELMAAYAYGPPKQVLKIEADEEAREAISSLSPEKVEAVAKMALSTERRDDGPEPDDTKH